MTDKQLQTHKRIQELIKEIDEINNVFMENPDIENGRELKKEMFASFHELRNLYKVERTYAFNELARDLGYDDKEAKDFTEYIEYINKNTSARPVFKRKRK